MRKRIEDLGRIAALMDAVLDLEIWDLYVGRNKDFVDHMDSLESDRRGDMMHKFIYGLSELRDELVKISEIADGRDSLNESSE